MEARKQAGEPEVEIVRIPEAGAKAKPGIEDPRVPLLRKRLKIEGDQDDARYDDSVIAAVKKFQQGAGLTADGMIGPATLRALNATPKRARVVDTIIVNMDRWRWYPRELGKVYVMVNIPDYSLRIVRDQKLFWNTRIVVGKPTQATPLTTAQMKFITVNPTWNVPPSIIANEYLPAVRQDPGVLERMGLRMEQNRDGTVRIYQPPGDRNALGRIRFNFPNKFLVYQHDTPDKHLFAHDKRAYSHGCMRVQDPLLYGEKLLSIVLPQEKYTQDKLREHVRRLGDQHQFPERPAGAPDLSDGVRGRGRHAADPRRRLWPRRRSYRRDQGRGAQGRRYRDPALPDRQRNHPGFPALPDARGEPVCRLVLIPAGRPRRQPRVRAAGAFWRLF